MAAARSLPAPIFMLRDDADMGNFTDEPGHGWTQIECASNKAYGCGEHDQEAVQGLKLYVRLGDGPLVTSSLAIRMTDEVLRSFDSQLDLSCPPARMATLVHRRRPMSFVGVVQMAEEQDLTVILVVFRRDDRPSELAYYLVYDHVGASLSMIKYLPALYGPIATMKPVVPKRRHGSSDDFELFLMASQSSPCDALCVCTPETRANPAASDGGAAGPWRIKKLCCFQREEIQEPFRADVAFSWQGMGFWADLSQGLVYCDLLHTNGVAVDVGFIGLPRECRLDLEETMEMEVSMKGTRTMGCVGDSIWFVCIVDLDADDDLVKMWTLKLPPRGGNLQQEARWEMVKEVRASELLGLDSFKVAGLPEGPFLYPVLTPDGDLSVILYLADQEKFPLPNQPICVFDMSLKRLRWHGLVHEYPFTDHVICPSNFLRREHGSRKRKIDDDGRRAAAGLSALAVAGSKEV